MIGKNYILYNNKTNLINIYYIKKSFKICTVKVRITPTSLSEQRKFF